MGNTQILDWCDPPPQLRGKRPRTTPPERPEWMLNLMTKPGVWAKLEDHISSAGSANRRCMTLKRATMFRGIQDEYEIVSRTIDKDRHGVWGRYVC